MFQKLILSVTVAAAALTSLVIAPTVVDAAPPALLPHHRFEVLAERGGAWQSRGGYQLQVRAELLAARVRHEGDRVEIRQF